jgi:1,4-dihydroxy-2-naphthoate octaprenyltransferase
MPQEPDISLLEKPLLRYWLATRPGFLLASIVPVLLGTASAAYQGTQVNILLFLACILGIALVHAGVNVLNDYYDHENGTDPRNVQRIFPFTGGSRFIQNGVLSSGETFLYGSILLVAAILLGLGLAWVSGTGLLWIGMAGVLLGWGYSAPPLQLNSRGFGELAVALGFGVLTPLGAWFVQTGEMAVYPLLTGLPIALLVMNILIINQFPDLEADAASGKHHWVVRLGTDKAPWLYLAAVLAATLILLLLVIKGLSPLMSLLGLLPLGMAFKAGLLLKQYAGQPQMLEPAIKMTIGSAILYGVLASLVLWQG